MRTTTKCIIIIGTIIGVTMVLVKAIGPLSLSIGNRDYHLQAIREHMSTVTSKILQDDALQKKCQHIIGDKHEKITGLACKDNIYKLSPELDPHTHMGKDRGPLNWNKMIF